MYKRVALAAAASVGILAAASPTTTPTIRPTSASPTPTGSPTATSSPTGSPSPTSSPPPSGAAPALHVSGNKLLTAAGKTYRLLGVNRSSAEFACVQGKGLW